MAIEQVKPVGITIYDLDKVAQETDVPVRDICHQMRASVRGDISDETELFEVCTGITEAVKDVEIHSNPEYPRIILVTRMAGETVMRLMDVKKPEEAYDPEMKECGLECNGYGKAILNAYARLEYTSTTIPTDNGELHMGILRIKHDSADRPQLN